MVDAERELCKLEGIEQVAMTWDGRSITEIHVISSSKRPPRLVSRDVESFLKAKRIKVDFKTISVAHIPAGEKARESESPPEMAAERPAPEPEDFSSDFIGELTRNTDPPNGKVRLYAAPEPMPPPQIVPLVPEEPAPRLRLRSVNVQNWGYKAQAEVELGCGSIEVLGTAKGTNTRLGTPRLVVQAALEALKQLLSEEIEFALEALEFVELGGQRLALVAVACLEDRHQHVYYGTAPIEGEPNQAVVSATLDALNRSFGRFRQKERIEYELRPTSIGH